MEVEMNTIPVREGRYWRMPDGDLVPYIAGGADGDGDTGAGDDDTGTGAGGAAGTGDAGTGDTGGTSDDTERLRKDLRATRTEAGNYRRRLREMEDKLEGIDVDKYQTLVQAEQEANNKQLADKGKYDELLAEHERRTAAQLEQSQKLGDTWKTRYEQQVIDNVLLGSSEEAVNAQEAVTLIRSSYKFGVNDNGDVEIIGGDGQVVLTDNGSAASPAHVMKEFLASRPHLCKPKGGGSGSQGGGAPGKSGGSNAATYTTGAERIAAALRARNGG